MAIAGGLWFFVTKQQEQIKVSSEKLERKIEEHQAELERIAGEKGKYDKLLMVAFLSVGQGDSTVIRTPDGKFILIDSGPPHDKNIRGDPGQKVILPFLRKHGAKELYMAVLTHSDADHIGGMPYIFKNFPVRSVLDQAIPTKTTELYHTYLKLIKEKKIKFIPAMDGDVLNWGDKVFAQVLWPREPLEKRKSIMNVNLHSIVIKMVYGKISFLFTGDIEKAAETEIFVYRSNLKSTILKSPHHGSKTSSLESFLGYIKPEAIAILCGKNNKFGFPHDVVIDRYKNCNSKIYRTDLDGNIIVYTNGIDYKVIKDK